MSEREGDVNKWFAQTGIEKWKKGLLKKRN
jgi:hypothetical protein